MRQHYLFGSVLVLVIVALASTFGAQTPQDDEALRALPRAFSEAFNRHDAAQLGHIMTEDVDFVTVGLTWLHGRSDFEKYHGRLFANRFKEITHEVIEIHIQWLRPDVAVVRHSWSAQGDKNVDGSARPPRFGMMTMVAEKRSDVWMVSSVQNVNAQTTGPSRSERSDELGDIKSPIVVPTSK